MKRCLPLFALAVMLLAGCGRDAPDTLQSQLTSPAPMASVPRAAALFQPLEIGDRWTYERVVHLETFPAGGGADLHAVIEREVVGEADVEGTTYRIVEERTFDDGDPVPGIYRLYWRQDRSGLYFIDQPPPGPLSPRADRTPSDASFPGLPDMSGATRHSVDGLLVKRAAFLASVGAAAPASVSVPRAAGPGVTGTAPTEYPFLVYPLHVGRSWIERPAGDPVEFKRTVTGREALDLPTGRTSAWRVRHEIEVFGPNDHATFWYDRNGSPGYVFHAEGVETDPGGTPIGTIVWHETVTLTSFDLTEPGR